CIEYGLRVVTRDVNTHKVQSVECLFCVYFSRTPSIPDTRQRKLTSRIKSWTAPWRAELFSKHHEHQHPSKWMEYQSASFDDKRIFFDNKEKFKNTIHNAFGNGEDSLVFKINPSIVQEIIGDMFFLQWKIIQYSPPCDPYVRTTYGGQYRQVGFSIARYYLSNMAYQAHWLRIGWRSKDDWTISRSCYGVGKESRVSDLSNMVWITSVGFSDASGIQKSIGLGQSVCYIDCSIYWTSSSTVQTYC